MGLIPESVAQSVLFKVTKAAEVVVAAMRPFAVAKPLVRLMIGEPLVMMFKPELALRVIAPVLIVKVPTPATAWSVLWELPSKYGVPEVDQRWAEPKVVAAKVWVVFVAAPVTLSVPPPSQRLLPAATTPLVGTGVEVASRCKTPPITVVVPV